MATVYTYDAEYFSRPLHGLTKVMHRRIHVYTPLKDWSRKLYDEMEKYLASKSGGGSATIMNIKEVQ